MDTKIIFEVKDNKADIYYEPGIDESTCVSFINHMLNSFPNAMMDALLEVPLLRPACEQEKDLHTYVFSDGDDGEVENKLYKFRKHLYDNIATLCSNLLTTAFPDIEYIERCKNYQQEFCMTHDELEIKEYTESVSELTTYVREHMTDILKEVVEQYEQETE